MNNYFRPLLLAFFLIGCKSYHPIAEATEPKENKTVRAEEAQKEDNNSLDEKIGQMILVGINDRTTLATNDQLRKEIEQGKMGGIVLFEKNISSKNSKETLKKLISDMQSISEIPLFIAIDEEGGKVHRLKS